MTKTMLLTIFWLAASGCGSSAPGSDAAVGTDAVSGTDSATGNDAATGSDAAPSADGSVTATVSGMPYASTRVMVAVQPNYDSTVIESFRDPPANALLRVDFNARAPGTYECGRNANIRYVDLTIGNAEANSMYGSCTVTVTEFGASGGMIRGTFVATLATANGNAMISDGRFDVRRP